ncbi:MAG: pitrilysin family protein [Paracoccaceae bacterium]|jgi:zinc protease|nr:pitrilysin family protein [Paracoccaceae bacterium]
MTAPLRLCAALGLALAVAAPARAAIDITQVTSPGGIDAWMVEEHSIPMVALELRFEGGASLDAEDKRGAIHLMTALLEEGAGEMDSQAFSIAADELAARFDFEVGPDSLAVSAQFLSENADAALELLRLALTEPRFDENAIERVRAQVLSNLASDTKDPDTIATDRYNALAFPGHPYGTPHEGTPESVAALTRDDLVAAKDRVMALDRVHVAAVGDIDAEELGAMLDDLLGGLPERGAPLPGAAESALKGGVTVVEFDTPQSVVAFGHEGIGMDHPDFFPAFVLTQILGGGGLNSRLMEEVRRERGLTYGIYAGLWTQLYADQLRGFVSTVNDRVGETVGVVRNEWERMVEEGVTEEELERAKTYLTGAYPLRFDGNERIANILVGMQLDDMPIDYVNTRNDKVAAVTLQDVQRVAAEVIRPDDLHFVVVGKPQGLDAGN